MSEVRSYETRGGIGVTCSVDAVDGQAALDALTAELDAQRGVLLASSYEYPGRYTRWDMGFANPAARARRARPRRRDRGAERARPRAAARRSRARSPMPAGDRGLRGERRRCAARVVEPEGRFPEEERSRQPSVFSVLRALIDLFGPDDDPHLGLYGAFGYDLALPVRAACGCSSSARRDQRDLVLYLPDELIVVDHRRERATRRRYDFEVDGARDRGPAARAARSRPYDGRAERRRAPATTSPASTPRRRARREGGLQARRPVRGGARPDLLRAVRSIRPSTVFRRLRERNPAPYGFLINLGEGEYLVGASPEMYVRVDGRPRRDLPDLRHDRARPRRRSRTRSRSWRCSTRRRTSPS